MAEIKIRIPDEKKARLLELMPTWGAQQHVFGKITDRLIEMLEGEHGQLYLGMLMSGELTLAEMMKLKKSDESS